MCADLAPEELVQEGIDADILSSHGLASEIADRLQSAGSTLLEGAAQCRNRADQ